MTAFLRFIVILSLALVAPASARFPHGSSSSVVFTHVPIGGAGAVMGVSSVPSANLLLARTDQFNCYISINNSQWSPLLKTNNTPIPGPAVSSVGTPTGIGCGDAIAAPSAPTNIWVENSGQVWLSTDSGANFGSTCYPTQTDGGPIEDQPTKAFAHILAIDPANPNIAYMGTDSNGLYATYDKGAHCFLISAVGTATNVPGGSNNITGAASGGNHLISFDTSAGTTTTCPHSATICTNNIYVSTYGTGIYQATDAGVSGTWTLKNSTGMPTTHIGMKADPFGNLFFIDNSNSNTLGTLHKFNGTSWSIPSGGPLYGIGLDIDPNSCASAVTCHIAVVDAGGTGTSGSAFSVNGGSTWVYSTTPVVVSSADVPWIADLINNGFGSYSAGAAFDNSGHVYTGGEGAFYFTPPTSTGSVTYTSKTVGIEESLSSNVVTSAYTTGRVATGTWDVNCFVQLSQPYTSLPTTTPNRGCYATNTPVLQHTFAIDWASDTSSFFVALTDNQQYGAGYLSYSGKSTDGGATWATLSVPASVGASQYGMSGGCLAAASTTNYILAPSNGNAGTFTPQYTTNGGTSWNRIGLTNLMGSVTASATAASGTSVLTFTSVPSWVTAGMGALDDTTPASTQGGPTIVSKTTTTITLNKTLSGQVTSGDSIYISAGGWPSQNYLDAKVCAADRDTTTNPNTFYLYNWNDGVSDAFIKCTSGGASCAIQSTPSIGANSPYSGVIKTVPGKAGNFFFSYRGNDPPDPATGSFRYYTDGGITPNIVPLMTMVFAFGFGAAAPGHTYPTIVVNGAYNGAYGIWQSIDWDGAKTWQRIGTYPKNLAVYIKDIDGDKVIPNVFYYTTNSGLFCSAPSTAYCNGGT
jgi:hypothetical protein